MFTTIKPLFGDFQQQPEHSLASSLPSITLPLLSLAEYVKLGIFLTLKYLNTSSGYTAYS